MRRTLEQGFEHLRAGRIPQARALFEDGLAAATKHDSARYVTAFSIQVATCLKMARPPEHERVLDVLQPALTAAERSGDRKGVGVCLLMLGGSESIIGRLNEAMEHLMRAAEIFKEVGDTQGLNDAMKMVMGLSSRQTEARRPRCPKCGGPLTALPPKALGRGSVVGYKCMACYPG